MGRADFDEFFDGGSKYEGDRIRAALYGDRARAAFRSVQPFRIHEEAILLGVDVTDTYDQEYRWSELYRLTQLSNLDKHRRLTLTAWWPDLVYWMSNGPSQRRWLGGDGTFADGSVLGYMVGQDADVGDEVFHDFNPIWFTCRHRRAIAPQDAAVSLAGGTEARCRRGTERPSPWGWHRS